MIRTYLKQAWNIIRQNRLFSSIYVIGTALAIAITMTLFVIYYVKVAPVYPEYNRWRTMKSDEISLKIMTKGDDGAEKKIAEFNGSGMNRNFIGDVLADIENVDACTAINQGMATYIMADNGKPHYGKVVIKYTDQGFWKVFAFDFLYGRPFLEGDMVENTQSAIITSKLAKTLFASEDVTGRKIEVNNKNFNVIGVVKSPSAFISDSYADIYIPFSVMEYQEKPFSIANASGPFKIIFTAKGKKDVKKILEDIKGTLDRLQAEDLDSFNSGKGGEYRYELAEYNIKQFWQLQMENDSSKGSVMETMSRLMLLVFSLLIVPAINLSSMISSRMAERKAEIGIRFAFGATKASILKQILWENMLLTSIGGVVGLVLTWLLVSFGAEWVLTIFDLGEGLPAAAKSLNADMLINPYIFMTTFIVCLAINIISALMPAIWALKHTIAESLNSKK